MKAIVYEKYGSPDVLEVREIDKPVVTDDGVLVRVHAASVNPVDWHIMTGTPYLVRLQAGLRKPKSEALGVDFAGTVEAVGSDVKQFQPGDEVFGARTGAFAEYVCVREERAVVHKAGRRHVRAGGGRTRGGDHRAAGSSRQGADSAGAEGPDQRRVGRRGHVRRADRQGVRRGRDRRLQHEERRHWSARSAPTTSSTTPEEDFTRSGQRYDLMLDVAGNRSWSDCRRVLDEKATLVVVGGPKGNRWIGPLSQALKLRLGSVGSSRRVVAPFLAKINKADLVVLQELLEAGTVTPVIDRQYELSEVAGSAQVSRRGTRPRKDRRQRRRRRLSQTSSSVDPRVAHLRPPLRPPAPPSGP